MPVSMGEQAKSHSIPVAQYIGVDSLMNKLEYFDRYVEAGMKVIPLHAHTKVPVGSKWNVGWNKDRCRKYIADSDDCNLGILLGEIVDVEGDTEEANAYLESTLRNCPHPQYMSFKSVHHLFINPDPKLTMTRFNGMEFRGWLHQSVLPPSIHEKGASYLWLPQSVFPVPKMPLDLFQYYMEYRSKPKKPRAKNFLKPEHRRTVCKKCGGFQFIHQKRLMLEVRAFADLDMKWLCHRCRTVDLRPACRRIRKQLESP